MAYAGISDLLDGPSMPSHQSDDGPSPRLLPQSGEDGPASEQSTDSPPLQWVVPERPPLDGWIPEGWQPADRIQDISPSLPDGYWLDPVKLEKPNGRHLLKSRLCEVDRSVVAGHVVPGAAIAERLYRHCSNTAARRTASCQAGACH